jgi:hypothetical protein
MGMGVFVLLATCLAVAANLLTRRFALAVLMSSVTSAVVFQAMVWFQLGHLDPLAPVAFVMSIGVAAAIGVAIGGAFVLARR